MIKPCRQCAQPLEITAEDLKFYDKISPVFDGKKFPVPPPTLCPDCRQQRRLAFRNQMKLYNRSCDLCGKNIISMYAPHPPSSKEKSYTVYCPACWWSDKWDPLNFGHDFDATRPFFDQFNELKHKVPHLALHVTNNENSDYVNLSGYNKNCYLIFAAEYNQDCLYGTQVIKSKDCLDTLNCLDSQYCYDVVDVENCYRLSFSRNCKNCSDSMFLYDCRNCSDCMFSTNLRNKQYYIFNKPNTKEEYQKKKADILEQMKSGKLEELKKTFKEIDKQAIHKYTEMLNCEGSSGDYLSDSKNTRLCFDLAHAQDCEYVYTGYNVKDLMDVAHTTEVELAYEGTSIGYKSYNVHFAMGAWSCNNGYYLDNVHNSSNIFGCIGLKRNKYCILNKQYSKEEYEKLMPKIIEHMKGEWGEFFPVSLSPFGYNETLANEYFPLSKAEALKLGAQWKEPETMATRATPTVKIPENIHDVTDEITKQILLCSARGNNKELCGKNYKIVPQELDFYKKMSIPLPKNCAECRHKKRLSLRNHRQLWNRTCGKCGTDIKTSYAQDRPETVYCEKCYLDAVV